MEYAARGTVDEWIQLFLRNDGGNIALADGLLLEKRYYIGPVVTDISEFGIEAGAPSYLKEANDVVWFFLVVDKMKEALGNWDLPPLIVNYDKGIYEINDGRHRNVALRQMNIKNAPVIFWTSNQEDYRYILEHKRSPFQVLIFPYLRNSDEILFAIFQRGKEGYWQGIAGGGEDAETPLQAAQRESWEEAGISSECKFVSLDSLTTLPVEHVVGGFLWGEDNYVMPEYSFGVELRERYLQLSHEHSQYNWVNYETASKMLKWDSNKNAIWELNKRISKSDKNGASN